MNRMTKIIAALALAVPAAAAAQDTETMLEPMTFEMFQEAYGNEIDPANDDRVEFDILDVDNDGVLSAAEQMDIEDAGVPSEMGTDDIETDEG